MYTQQNDTPEFVSVFANNLIHALRDVVETEVYYKYNSMEDRLIIILEPIYTIKFAYKIDNITKILVQTRTTVSLTTYTVLKKYKKHILGKFFKDTKNP